MYKKKILLSAYAVKPFSGSEPGVGWYFFSSLAMDNELDIYLITEEEFKDQILEESKRLGFDKEKIFFVNVGKEARKKYWNQGDWSFYIHYDQWQKKVLKLAEKLHSIRARPYLPCQVRALEKMWCQAEHES